MHCHFVQSKKYYTKDDENLVFQKSMNYTEPKVSKVLKPNFVELSFYMA